MKKRALSLFLIILLMISMLVVLTACSADEEKKTDKKEASSLSNEEADIEELAQETSEKTELVKLAQNAMKATKLASAKEAIYIAVLSLSEEYLGYYTNNISLKFADYATYEMLDNKLKEERYKICTKTSADGTIEDMSQSIVGEVYFTELEDSDATIYKATIESNQYGANATNVEKVN